MKLFEWSIEPTCTGIKEEIKESEQAAPERFLDKDTSVVSFLVCNQEPSAPGPPADWAI